MPAAVLVSIGCSVARRATPRVFSSCTVLHRAGQAVDACDDQRVTRLHEVEQHLQLGAPVAPAAAGFLGPDDGTASGLKRGPLQAQVLVDGGNTGVAIEWHEAGPILSRWSLDPPSDVYQVPQTHPKKT